MEQKKYERKPGSGTAFRSKNKTKESQPDYSGPFKGLDGKEYRIAIWVNDDRLSIMMSETQEQKQRDEAHSYVVGAEDLSRRKNSYSAPVPAMRIPYNEDEDLPF